MQNELTLNGNNSIYVSPRDMKDFAKRASAIKTMDAKAQQAAIAEYGYGGYPDALRTSVKAVRATMDSAAVPQVSPSTPALSQFFQFWETGVVKAFTAPRKAEELMGYHQSGSFETDTVIIRSLEQHAGVAQYGDLADTPLTNYNANFPFRHSVRFQAGLKTTHLESARMATIGFNDQDEKREALRVAFEINENAIMFYGFNSGLNRTYGLFNDPNLEAIQTLPNNAANTSALWANKTWDEKYNDVIVSVNRLITNTKQAFDPYTEAFTWAISTYINTHLMDRNSLGLTLKQALTENYPQMRIVPIPQMDGANGGADVWYMYKDEKVNVDVSTDDGATIIPMTQTRMFLISSLPNEGGGVNEKYAHSCAGVFVKRPLLLVRFSGFYTQP